MNEKNKFEVLTGRLQILQRPTMWIGAVDKTKQNMFVLSEDKVEHKEVEYVAAFRKIIDEILDNSLDALIAHRNSSGTIRVKMDDEKISIEDDGPGIPVIKKKLSELEEKNLPEEEAKQIKNSYLPQLAWTRLFSGSNFQDGENKTTIGAHGVGSTATVIFSTKFIGKTDDGKKSCTVKALNNMEKVSCSVGETSKKSGTIVEFWPDLKRFKLDKVETVYQDIMRQRLLCLAITFPKIKFYFNGKRIDNNEKKFMKLFSEDIVTVSFDKGFIGVYPNESDEFNFFTYVNGMHMGRGGSHVDFISWQIVNPIREKLVKKYKSIKPADIRNRLSLVVFMRDFPNPKFDSQTKETLTNAVGEISSYLNNSIDFEKFAKILLKTDVIINPIIDMFKLKEELKAKQELKKVKKIKVKSDKYMSPIGEQKYLALCEGASAMSGISSCLGRNGIGYYGMRGLPLNSYSATMQKIVANAELKDIINILELDISKTFTNKTIAFDKILIATDADIDGVHITSMLIGWFKRFSPNLFNEGKICKLLTPLVMLKDNKDNIVKFFFTMLDFKKWELNNQNHKYKVHYNKGLGSFEKDELIGLFTKFGLDNFILEYHLDNDGEVYIEDWLGNDPEKRKKYLREYTLDINSI